MLTDEHVRSYFLYLREEKKLARSSINVAVYAVRFLCATTLRRDWPVFELLRVKMPERLPVVLSRQEVRQVLGAVRHPVRRVALTAIYALGLRLGEGLRLEAEHIDGQRLSVSVRDGKGARDRDVPLPRPLLARLRRYWKLERPASSTKYLFVGRDGIEPMHETTLQKTLERILKLMLPAERRSARTRIEGGRGSEYRAVPNARAARGIGCARHSFARRPSAAACRVLCRRGVARLGVECAVESREAELRGQRAGSRIPCRDTGVQDAAGREGRA
jgi:integrase